MTTKPRHRLTLKDRLSRLTFLQACKLMGPEAEALIQKGGRIYDEINLDRDVYLRGDLFRLKLFDVRRDEPAVVTFTMMTEARNRLKLNCTVCQRMCEHIGAALSLILEDKTALGLAKPPEEREPMELLAEDELVAQALADREERAREEKFRLKASDPGQPWTDYVITSAASGKTSRVALRGEQRGESYCGCPDFRTNTLGTCKHVMYALDRVRKKFTAAKRGKPFRLRD